MNDDILEKLQLSYNPSEEKFKDALEEDDDGSLDEAHSIFQIDIGEPYLTQCHNIKSDGRRPLNVWMCYTASNDDEVHMVQSPDIAGYQYHRWQFSSSSRRDKFTSIGGFL